MQQPPDPEDACRIHYLIDSAASPEESWRVVAAHHLLTSRHQPLATMSIVGVDEATARQLRIYATELGLSGLRIPDNEPPAESVRIDLPESATAPSVLCEYIALSLAASVSTS